MTYTVKTLTDNWDSLSESECAEAAIKFKALIESAGKSGDQDSQKVLSSWVGKLESRIADLRAGRASVQPRQPQSDAKPSIQPSSTAVEILSVVLDVLRQAREHPAVKADEAAAAAINECGLVIQNTMTEPGPPEIALTEPKPEKSKKAKEGGQ